MTTLAPPAGRLDPRPQRWTYDLATLAGVGVVVDDEQAALLDPDGHVSEVVVPYALTDPLLNVDGLRYEWELPRMWVHDDYGPQGTVVIPALGLVDWQMDGLDPQDWFHGSAWWRFPSIPVRVIVPDGGDEAGEIARCMRVWNCWPLYDSHNDVGSVGWDVVDTAERLYNTGWYGRARNYANWKAGKITGCQLVDLDSPEDHCHTEVGDCLTAPARIADLEHRLFIDGAWGWWRNPHLAAGFTDERADRIWAALVASSKRNSAASLHVVPDWEIAALAESEKRFCPWVLS